MKAVIEVDVPAYQIGQEVSVYFKDTMCIKGVCQGDGTIEELEKIRTEIGQIVDEEQEHDKKWAIGLRYSLKIIDKHISELKGENK